MRRKIYNKCLPKETIENLRKMGESERNVDRHMDQVISELFHLLHRVHQCRLRFQKQGNMANVEYYMLMGIAVMTEKHPEGITMRRIADVSHMTMSAVSKKISILEKKGLVTRRNSETDRRNVYITLTEQGKMICKQEKERKHAWMKKVVERMGEEDMLQMIALSNRMFDIMEELESRETEQE